MLHCRGYVSQASAYVHALTACVLQSSMAAEGHAAVRDPAALSSAADGRAENGLPSTRGHASGAVVAHRRAVADRVDAANGPDSALRRFCLTGSQRRCVAPIHSLSPGLNMSFHFVRRTTGQWRTVAACRPLLQSSKAAAGDALGLHEQQHRPQQHLTPSTVASAAVSHTSSSADPAIVRCCDMADVRATLSGSLRSADC